MNGIFRYFFRIVLDFAVRPMLFYMYVGKITSLGLESEPRVYLRIILSSTLRFLFSSLDINMRLQLSLICG